MIVKAFRDGDFCLFRFYVCCPRCDLVTVVLPHRQDQEIVCIMCNLTLGIVDGMIVGIDT